MWPLPLGIGVTGWPAMLGDALRKPRATLPPDATPVALAHPWFWWGPRGAPHAAPCLSRLVAGGVLALPVAGLLAAAVCAGASVAAVAVPGGAGKTTLLSALAAALPPERLPVHLRGSYEDFAAFADPTATPETMAVLVNELSDHLPVYLWGDGLARLARLRAAGFQVLATAHAVDARGLARLLEGPGAGLPPGTAAGLFDLVVGLEPGPRASLVESACGGGSPEALSSRAGAAEVSRWLAEAARGSPALAAIVAATLPGWERWAATPAAPAPDPDRPGAMLAKRGREVHGGHGSP